MLKKKQAPAGAPEWIVTYGDTMSLLLCFFIILVSMGEIKKDEQFQQMAESMRQAFGWRGGIGQIDSAVVPTNSMTKQMVFQVLKKMQMNEGKSSDSGIEGENPSVKSIREGTEYTMGGQVVFDEGSAELLETGRAQLAVFSKLIRGYNNKIRIRAHASRIPPDRYRPFKTLDDLTYARGVAVKTCLVENGVSPENITIEACGDNEPVSVQAYDEASRALNRRVSVIITDKLVEEYQGDPGAKKTEN